jgi:hypothetical protein
MLDLDPKLYVIPKDIMPELLLLGTLENVTQPMDDGVLMSMTVVHYEGKVFVMKQETVGRWFDER